MVFLWLSLFFVIPAQAGTQGRDVWGLIPIFPGLRPFSSFTFLWVSAFAGMTTLENRLRDTEETFRQRG
jgi:hypothetical protein